MKKSNKLKELRKQLLALSLAGSMAFGVTGCGNAKNESATNTDAKQETTTEASTQEEPTTQDEKTDVDGLTLYDDTEEKERVNNAVNNYKNKKGTNAENTDPNTTVTTNSDGSKVKTKETTEALDPHVGTTEAGNSNSTTTTGSSSTGTQTTTEVLPEEKTTEEPKPVDYNFDNNNKDARKEDQNRQESVTVQESSESRPSLPSAPKVDYNYDKQESTTQEQTTQEEVIEYEDYEEDDEFILPPLPEDDITSKSNKTFKLVMRG